MKLLNSNYWCVIIYVKLYFIKDGVKTNIVFFILQFYKLTENEKWIIINIRK